MRKKIVAGNWKMNTNYDSGLELAREINEKVAKANLKGTGIILGVPFILVADVVKNVDKDNIGVAAQNSAAWEKGAYTGEISADMVKSTGAGYVILGHSERRKYFKETESILKEKTELALASNLEVIFCCGEVLEERNDNKHFEIIKRQISDSLFHLSAGEFSNIIIAYEPVWAIGTGVTASSDQAQEMHSFIRKLIAEKFGDELAGNTAILYGGSCNPGNARELFSNPDVDGGLIGGASLKADDFINIIDSF